MSMITSRFQSISKDQVPTASLQSSGRPVSGTKAPTLDLSAGFRSLGPWAYSYGKNYGCYWYSEAQQQSNSMHSVFTYRNNSVQKFVNGGEYVDFSLQDDLG